MQHTVEDLIEKIDAMHSMAIKLHRERNKYSVISGLEYDKNHCQHLLDQIQQMAFEIAHDKNGDEILTRMEYKK